VTPGTERIAVSTSPGMLAATGQAGVVNVISDVDNATLLDD
jgi:hypothetical protein